MILMMHRSASRLEEVTWKSQSLSICIQTLPVVISLHRKWVHSESTNIIPSGMSQAITACVKTQQVVAEFIFTVGEVQVFTSDPFPLMDQLGQLLLKLALLPVVPEKLPWHLPFYVNSFFTKGETLADKFPTPRAEKLVFGDEDHSCIKCVIQEHPTDLPQTPPPQPCPHYAPLTAGTTQPWAGPKLSTGCQVTPMDLQPLHPAVRGDHRPSDLPKPTPSHSVPQLSFLPTTRVENNCLDWRDLQVLKSCFPNFLIIQLVFHS